MKRVMMDLETLDTGNDALILSIGACTFDDPEGIGQRLFYTAVKQDLQESKWKRTTSQSTKDWWDKQSMEAKKVFTDPAAVFLDAALLAFNEWLDGQAPEMWANGPDFDCVILGSAYGATGLQRPWSYSKNRCFRTLKNLGLKLAPGEGPSTGAMIAHNALDDALYQAKYATAWLSKIPK